MTIIEIAKKLNEQRSKIDKLKEKHGTEMQEQMFLKEELQMQLMAAMKEQGMKTVGTEQNTISIAQKKTPKVVDQSKLDADLEQRGLLEDMYVKKFDTIRFKSVANNLLKDTGEVLDGTDIEVTEYISIRNKK